MNMNKYSVINPVGISYYYTDDWGVYQRNLEVTRSIKQASTTSKRLSLKS